MFERSARFLGAILALGLFCGISDADSSDWRRGYAADPKAENDRRRGRPPAVSLDRAVANVRKHGHVLSAESVRRGGRDVHRIRILTEEGRVRNLYVDAQTGKLLRR